MCVLGIFVTVAMWFSGTVKLVMKDGNGGLCLRGCGLMWTSFSSGPRTEDWPERICCTRHDRSRAIGELGHWRRTCGARNDLGSPQVALLPQRRCNSLLEEESGATAFQMVGPVGGHVTTKTNGKSEVSLKCGKTR